MPYIRETILTTRGADGAVHIAPLGIIADGERWVVAPFRPSRTLENIAATGIAVANYTDDARIFAGCLTGRRNWPTVPVEGCPVPRLEAALAHDVLEVVDTRPDETRPRFVCRIAASGQHGPFTGMNRAKAAVIEGAILVSRLHMMPVEKIEAEFAALKIAIDKTAGPDEEEAWTWLMTKVLMHLADARAGAGDPVQE